MPKHDLKLRDYVKITDLNKELWLMYSIEKEPYKIGKIIGKTKDHISNTLFKVLTSKEKKVIPCYKHELEQITLEDNPEYFI